MPAGDVYELTVNQAYAVQQISNVHHYVQVGPDGTGDARSALSSVWVNFYQVPFLNCLTINVTLLAIRVRRLLPIQTQQFFTSIGLLGAVLQDPLPTNQCAILREYANRDFLGTDNVARQIQRTRMTSRIKQVRSRTIGVGD